MKRSPSYVHRTPSGQFYFRIAVPKALRPYFGRREIKKVLPASRAAEAFGQAQPLAALVQKAFDECRTMTKKKSSPVMHHMLLKFGNGTEVSIDQDSAEEERRTAEALINKFGGPVGSPSELIKDSPKLLTDVIDEYCEEKRTSGSWKHKTEEENTAIFKLLVSIVGVIPIHTLDKGVARMVKSTLMKLPPNMNKDPIYRDKILKDIVSMNAARTLSVTSVNKHINRYSSFSKWAENQGYLVRNPFDGLQIKQPKAPHEQRKAFDEEDLKKLFGSEVYTAKKYKNPYNYWLPLLALFTGARQNELCQLSVDDIRQEGRIWVIDINERGDKVLKTPASARLIPIHSKLLELGFLEYLEEVSVGANDKLFPELKKYKDSYSKEASKWFTRYRKKHGVADDDKPFHSFRHTFTDALKQMNENTDHIEALLGHQNKSIAMARYGKPYSALVLSEVVERLNFDLGI